MGAAPDVALSRRLHDELGDGHAVEDVEGTNGEPRPVRRVHDRVDSRAHRP